MIRILKDKKGNELRAVKFTGSASSEPPNILHLVDGKGKHHDLTVKEYIKRALEFYNTYDLWRYGVVRRAGWSFDFRPYMKRYVFNQNFATEVWSCVYSSGKTIIRENYSSVIEIYEIANRWRENYVR